MKTVKTFENILVYANIDVECEIIKEEKGKNIFEYTFNLKWNEDEAKKSDLNGVEIRYTVPIIDAVHLWTPNCRTKRFLDAEWRTKNHKCNKRQCNLFKIRCKKRNKRVC